MMDQYKEQYKKETEQIHAPADLIARTKAAVREEEAKLQRERSEQTMRLTGQGVKPAARKWAYLLSAAAAVIVLVSVSLMMRGLRFDKLSSESPAYEMAAADSGGEESAPEEAAAGAAFDETVAAEEAVAGSSLSDTGEGAAKSAAVEPEAADEFATEGAADEAAETEDAASDMGMAFADEAGEAETTEETKRAADEPVAGESETENAMSQKQEAKEMPAGTAGAEITVEKVWKKPAFVNRADMETQVYEETVFQVVEEEDGWAAYVESENSGYVIRGEAESIEAFLEAGYKRLEEMSW